MTLIKRLIIYGLVVSAATIIFMALLICAVT
jgi:hypothetical protein